MNWKLLEASVFDVHVHAREPGQEQKETIETCSEAAIAMSQLLDYLMHAPTMQLSWLVLPVIAETRVPLSFMDWKCSLVPALGT